MTTANDPHTAHSELMQMTGAARMLIAALSHYEDDPTEAKWRTVLDAKAGLRELTDSTWQRFIVNHGAAV